jgi:hypothetical protein
MTKDNPLRFTVTARYLIIDIFICLGTANLLKKFVPNFLEIVG